MAFVCAIPAVGATVFMVNETDCLDAMDLYRELDVFQHHLIIVNAASQRDDVEIIISEADRDPRLEKFLQAVIHAVDYQRVAVDGRLLLFRGWHKD